MPVATLGSSPLRKFLDLDFELYPLIVSIVWVDFYRPVSLIQCNVPRICGGRSLLETLLVCRIISMMILDANPMLTCSNLRNFSQSSDSRSCGCGSWRSVIYVRFVQWRVSPSSRSSPILTYETVHAPPATVFLQPLHFQIPTECRLTVFFPQNVQTYRACWVISIFLTCLRRDAPYL